MNAMRIFQQQGRWLVFDGDQVSQGESRPRLERAALVVADFEGAVSSVMRLEGSPTHAMALIQKRLRSDGLVDSESKVLIHKTMVRGAGYQTLFTAVPLDVWQQTYAWAEAQPDHCLLIPCTSLLWRALKPGQGLILHSGRQISVLIQLRHEILYRSALAYSDDATDLMMTAGMLADQVASGLDSGEEGLEPPQMIWCSVLCSRDDQTGPWPDEQLREIFAARSGLRIEPASTRLLQDAQGRQYRSGIDWLTAHASSFSAVNPTLSRLSFLAERLLPLASAASVLVALGLGAIGARWTLSARHANQRSEQIQQQVRQIDAQIATLQGRMQLDPGFEATREFIERAAQLQSGIDPVAATRQVRDAADGQVRILRVLVEAPRPGNVRPAGVGMPPMPAGPQTQRVLRVDGTVDPTEGTPGMQVATFVERLRLAGYEPLALDPQANGVNTRGGGSVFSYLLKQATAGATPVTGALP